MIFLDTNILIYAAGLHGEADFRTQRARDVVDSDEEYAISVQVIQEFFDASTRSRGGRVRLAPDEALRFIEQWRTFAVASITLELFERAALLHLRNGFSYWDCAIIAAAQMSGSDTLFTEDMQHGQFVDGVRIVNPFCAQ